MADTPTRPEIPADTVCRIIVKARQFDVKEDVIEADYGGNPSDDQFRAVLEDYKDDPVFEELRTFIDDLDVDDRCEIVALMWVGRGDFEAGEWARALTTARQEAVHRTSDYLLGTPLLPDLLQEGLAQYGMSCEDFERQHL